MTTYQMLVDTMCSRLFKFWQDSYDKTAWNEENAKELAKLMIHDVEMFKMMQQSRGTNE